MARVRKGLKSRGGGGGAYLALFQEPILRVWEGLRRGETMDLHPVYLAVVGALRAQRHGPGPTQVHRDDGAPPHTHTSPAPPPPGCCTSLYSSRNGPKWETEKGQGRGSGRARLSKVPFQNGGRVLDSAAESPLTLLTCRACVSGALETWRRNLCIRLASCSGLRGVLSLRSWKPRSIKGKHQPSAFFPILLAFYSSQRAAAPGCCKSSLWLWADSLRNLLCLIWLRRKW